jgi:hypothetical protein
MASPVSFRDTIRTNNTLADMLLSVLLGLELETDWILDFSFTPNSDSSLLLGVAKFTETPAMRPSNVRGFNFSFRLPEGLTPYESLELLQSELELHCVAMSRGLVSCEKGHVIHSRWPGQGEKYSISFRKRSDRNIASRSFPQTSAQERVV